MPHIFISHSTKDNDVTRQIATILKAEQFSVWVDFESIRDGARWVREIEAGIDDSVAVVVVWSQHAGKSEWVEKECLYALDAKKPIFIALVEDARLRLYLINIQYTNCVGRLDAGMTELMTAIRTSLRQDDQLVNYPITKVSSLPTEANFFGYIEQLPQGETATWIAQDLYTWAQQIADEVEFGGSQNPGYHAKITLADAQQVTVFSIWAYPKTPSTQIPFDYLQSYPPFDNASTRQGILKQLNRLMPDDEQFPDDKAERRPTFPLQYLSTAEKLEGYKQILTDVINRLRSYS